MSYNSKAPVLRVDRVDYRGLYARLLAHYGPQAWWPAASPFEMILGAILTQNTAWTNVEQALNRLRRVIPLQPEALLALPFERFAEAIRPAGYFRVKTERIRNFCAWLLAQGGLVHLASWNTDCLRQALLEVRGIGPETADAILVYAFHRPVFIADAYARRLFSRLAWIEGNPDYETVRHICEAQFGGKAADYNEFHALIVAHAKQACRKQPRCDSCCLANICRYR